MPAKKLIFDTSVLSNFIVAEAETLLIKKYARRGVIPREVYDELSAGYKIVPVSHFTFFHTHYSPVF